MGPRALFVILSLAACGRGPEPAQPPAARPGDATPVVSADAPAGDAAVVAQPDVARPAEAPARVRRKLRLMEYEGPASGPIHYTVVEPDDANERTPLIIALHGRGDTAEGFARLVRRLELDARVIVGQGPLPFGLVGGRQWFDMSRDDAEVQVEARMDDLRTLLAQLAQRYPRAGKPGLFGFSQGAVLAFEAAHVMPERFAAIAPLSGFLAGKGAGINAEGPPMLVTAGTKDQLIAQDRSWAAAKALEELGRPVRRLAFEGPHTVPPQVVDALRAFFDETLPAPR